jgi:hypothetical protein
MSDRRTEERPGREGYHDPMAGFAGAPAARSALTLRLILAGIAVVVFGGGAIAAAIMSGPAVVIGVLAAVAAVSAVDVAVVARRKRHGEPG